MSTFTRTVGESVRKVRHRRYRLRALLHSVRRGLGTTARWLVLLGFVYLYLFPVLFMLANSVKTDGELRNPLVEWISREPTLANYVLAARAMGWRGLRNSVIISVLAMIGQTLVGAMIAYASARLRFPGRDFLFALLLFTIIVPPETIMLSLFMYYAKIGWNNTFLPLILPAWLGFGVRGGILLFVYRQFFRGLPYELEDAAYVDGAGPLRTFWQIMLPLAKPAILVVMLFSLVWTWNDSFLPELILRDTRMFTMPQQLGNIAMMIFDRAFRSLYAAAGLQENTFMAAVVLTVSPMLLMYLFAQRYFTQSIDRTGLVE